MTTLFVSDLHLDAKKPEIGNQFLVFLEEEVSKANALYILGDLFEVWLGDDDPDPYYAYIKMALYKITNSGVPIFFMHGNRDFMIGDTFSQETGVKIISDPTVIRLNNQDVLLCHGDTLCTDDTEYQEMRKTTRNPYWQAKMLARPLKERLAFAAKARENSKIHNELTVPELMDVNLDAVKKILLEYSANILLHGHTHRPNIHKIKINGVNAMRIVLGDWFEQGSVVRWDKNGLKLETMTR